MSWLDVSMYFVSHLHTIMTRSNTLIYIYDFALYVFYFFIDGDKYFIIEVCVCERKGEFLRLLCVGKALLVGSFVSSYLSVSKTEAWSYLQI